jgi:hypothetical protein
LDQRLDPALPRGAAEILAALFDLHSKLIAQARDVTNGFGGFFGRHGLDTPKAHKSPLVGV